jgi:hypothetical protein
VHEKAILERARAAVDVTEVVDRCALGVNAGLERRLDSLAQALEV